MNIFNKYPELCKSFEELYRKRPQDIISCMVEEDDEYRKLRNERAATSMILKQALDNINEGKLLERYSDAIYAQENYELSVIYKQAVRDTIDLLVSRGIM